MICSYFDKIQYISISDNIDRQKHIQQLFNSSSIKDCLVRFDAVNGKQIDIRMISEKLITPLAKKDIQKQKQKKYGFTLTYGSLGCALSHYLIYESCANAKKPFMVFEDDIQIDSHLFDDQLYSILEDIASNNIIYDILYLGLHELKCLDKSNKISKLLYKPQGCLYGTFAMIISPLGAIKLLSHIFPLNHQIDSSISKNKDKLKIICPINHIVHHDHKFGSLTQEKESCINFNI